MITNRTLTMIKPDAIFAGHSGAILQKITDAGFKIIALKLTHLNQETAGEFYKVHEGKPFYENLIRYMTSGPIIAAVLEKENAVADFRTLIGNTYPEKAEAGTIRKLYAKSLTENAIHGSDSDENAKIESSFHFNAYELVTY